MKSQCRRVFDKLARRFAHLPFLFVAEPSPISVMTILRKPNLLLIDWAVEPWIY